MTSHRDLTVRFSDNEVALGDEMRGARASKGVPLEQIAQTLKIRASHLAAIEDGRVQDLPGTAYLAGFVRAYARYLGIDQDSAWRRFQAQVGPVKPGSDLADPAKVARAAMLRGDMAAHKALCGGGALDTLARQRRKGGVRKAFGAASAMAMTVMIAGGVAWGAWSAFETLRDADLLPQLLGRADAGQAGLLYGSTDGAPETRPALAEEPWEIAAAPAPEETAIGEIPPTRAGAIQTAAAVNALPFDRQPPRPAPTFSTPAGPQAVLRSWRPADPTARGLGAPRDPAIYAALAQEEAAEAPAPAAPETVSVATSQTSWVQITNSGGENVANQMLRPEEPIDLPDGAEGLRLRTADAGHVYIVIAGTPHGPMGAPGQDVRDVSLQPDDARARFDPAEIPGFDPEPTAERVPPPPRLSPDRPAVSWRAPRVPRPQPVAQPLSPGAAQEPFFSLPPGVTFIPSPN